MHILKKRDGLQSKQVQIMPEIKSWINKFIYLYTIWDE